MIKIISTHLNTSLPKIKTILLVYQDWILPKDIGPRWKDIRNYLLHYRANPRSIEYMLELAKELLVRNFPGAKTDLLVSPTVVCPNDFMQNFGIDTLWKFSPVDTGTWNLELIEKIKQSYYDAVVFLYPDAIGLGWKTIEHNFRYFKISCFLVINGRRRFFFYDNEAQFILDLRRFASHTWLLEALLVPIFWLVGAGLSIYDSLIGQNEQQRAG